MPKRKLSQRQLRTQSQSQSPSRRRRNEEQQNEEVPLNPIRQLSQQSPPQRIPVSSFVQLESLEINDVAEEPAAAAVVLQSQQPIRMLDCFVRVERLEEVVVQHGIDQQQQNIEEEEILPVIQPPPPVIPIRAEREQRIVPTYRKACLQDGIFNSNEFPAYRLANLATANVCQHCDAYYFNEEITPRSNGESSLCCQRGKVHLPAYADCPPEINDLLTSITPQANHYRRHIRQYNCALAFASTVGNYQNMGVGPQVVKVNGMVHHVMPQVQPRQQAQAKFGQLYFLDTQDGQQIREATSEPCRPDVLAMLDDLIRRVNPYPRAYRMLRDVYREQEERCRQLQLDIPEVTLAIRPNIDVMFREYNVDPNTYNMPAVNEIAAIFIGDVPPFPIDLRLYPTRGEPQTIRDVSALTDPLSYPLLFPIGDNGWTTGIRHNRAANVNYGNVTLREYVAYRLACRRNFSILHNSCKLFQQYLVDSWCRIEGLNLYYIRTHQRELHSEDYTTLRAYVANQAVARGLPVGRINILPTTFIGSPRYMNQRYLDAMTIVATYGKPDLFITFTCNSTWRDIVDNLEPGQEAMHRPDLVCRIFKIKLDKLLDLIEKRQYFGRVRSLMHVIEFQKRGLPHAHILIILERDDKITEPEQVDSIIRAELPHPRLEAELYNLVCRNMIHRKCAGNQVGVTCLREGKCRFNYPKQFEESTNMGQGTYAKYRRRNDHRYFEQNNNMYQNTDVVPYSPVLLHMFEAHINVEVCASIKATKYLYKYVHKGHDNVLIDIQEGVRDNNGQFNWDEIDRYQDCRYVSAHEACWRIFSYPLSNSNISVFMLQIHLPDRQNIYFEEGNEDVAVARAENAHTHLTAWFRLNQVVNNNSRQYLFIDIVKYFTWQRQQRIWKTRKSHFNVLGRLPDISPNRGDLYYLRMLLRNVRGAQSFEDLRTIDGIVQPTFREACLALHLILNDEEYINCMRDAIIFTMPKRQRYLFAHILLWCNPQTPLGFWQTFCEPMSED